MSDFSQGPGWWQASDGKWYPPAQAPTGSTYLPQPGAGPVPAKTGTNGLAIAAFVLSILWICAVGSLLGLILGIIALSQIKKSGRGGKGLAIAAIIIGALGLAITAVTTVIVVSQKDKIVKTDPSEGDDVTITSCAIPDGGTRPTAELSITNDSSKRSTYLIFVEFSPTDGDTDVFTTQISPGPVDPDETIEVSVDGSDLGTSRSSADIRCRLPLVQRFAAE